MDIQNKLPQFTELDVEFSKYCLKVYDILMSNFNKKISMIEASRDDLFEFLSNELKKKKWRIFKSSYVDDAFPKGNKDGRINKFRLEADTQDVGFYALIDLKKQKNANSGLRIEVTFGLDNVSWYIGQFDGYEEYEEYLDYSFYKKAKDSIFKRNICNVIVAFPKKAEAKEENGQKWIEMTVDSKDLTKELIIEIQTIIKDDILKPMILRLLKCS